MKRKSIVLILMIVTLLTLTACQEGSEAPGLTSKNPKLEEFANVKTVDEIVAKVDKGETFAFVIGNENCPACLAYKDELIQVYKDDQFKFDYINLDENTDMILLQELILEKIGTEEDRLYTPTTFYIVNGEKAKEAVGSMSADKIKEAIKLLD